MRRILITGMSGTGKSSVIEMLAARGLKAIDTDWNPEWERIQGDEWVWREEQIRRLLDQEDADALFVSACVSNQGKFYGRFDHIILLTAPESVTVHRLASRTNNPYGKQPAEIADVLRYKATIEPRLRVGATAEIDTSIPLADVVAQVLEIAFAGR
jgi:dephospho-CoA kinase